MKSREKKIIKELIMWIFIFPFFLKPAFSEEIKVEAEGIASFNEQDQVSSRSKAIQDLEKQAIIKAVMEIIGKEQYNQNKEKIERVILHKFDSYIKAYKIIKEEASEGKYKVKGEAIIESHSLKKALSSLNLSSPEAETGKKSYPTILWSYDRSCDQEIEGKNAGDLFTDIFLGRVTDYGFTVVSSDQASQDSLKVMVRGNFFCFENKVEFRMEVVHNSQKYYTEDFVPISEETVLMDAIMTLAEISTNNLIQVVDSGQVEISGKESIESKSKPNEAITSGSEGEKPSPSSPWQIVIKDPQGTIYWEKLYKRLKEVGASIEVLRILISPEAVTVETSELNDKSINIIESISPKDGLNLKVELVDSQARQLVIRPQTEQ
ncbi:MAG: hypothetical protein N2260_03855 [Syntrophobacterales bacterium]|nr:hypothetical protein [Syntrophobacterales bacterium]